MRAKCERRDHSEVAASASQSPKKAFVFGCASSKDSAIGRYDLTGKQVVDGHAVLPNQPADATTEGEARYPGFRDNPARYGESKRVSLTIQVAKRCAALHADRAISRIYVHRTHARKVNDNAVIAKRAPSDIMSAAANGCQKIVFSGIVNSGDDVCGSCTAGNQAGSFVNACVPDPAGLIVPVAAGLE